MNTIKKLTDEFVKIAKEKGITLEYSNKYGVDPDIFNWLPNACVSTEPVPTGGFTKVDTEKGTTQAKMLETAVKMSLSQAIQKFTQMLQSGDFDKLETYRIIFLTETNNKKNPLKLICHRHSDGELNLIISKVYPDHVWFGAGRAWFSSNEPYDPNTSSLCTSDTLKNKKGEITTGKENHDLITKLQQNIKKDRERIVHLETKLEKVTNLAEQILEIISNE